MVHCNSYCWGAKFVTDLNASHYAPSGLFYGDIKAFEQNAGQVGFYPYRLSILGKELILCGRTGAAHGQRLACVFVRNIDGRLVLEA